MPTIDLSGLTVPIFSAVFGMGWAACYTIVVAPLKQRVDALETRMLAIDEIKDRRIMALEMALGIKPVAE